MFRARRIRVAVGLVALASAGMIAWPWLHYALAVASSTPQFVVGLIAALEVAYGIILFLGLAGLAASFGFLQWARTRRRSRRVALAGLLAAFACLLGLVLVEAASASWLASENWATARALARSGLTSDVALPTTFPEASPPDEVNLVIVGESSAVGFPCREWLNIGKVVAWGLGRAIPARRFHVELVAHEGDTLERQHQALARLRRRPDAILVYCGHNEFAARYASTRDVRYYVNQPTARGEFLSVAGLTRWSPFCRLLRRIGDRHRVGLVPAQGSRRPVVDVPVYGEADLAERVADFGVRLERIVAYCRQLGALPILVLPPGNDADFEPNRSYLSPSSTRAERDAFAREFLALRRVEEADPGRCIAGYRDLLARQSGFAEAHFRLARLLERTGKWDEAYEHFVAARDLDGLPVRCPSILQQAYRDVAARYDAVLVDGQAVFHAIGAHGLLDDRLFHDAMHPSVRGHIVLAEAVLKALHARGAFGWAAEQPPPVLDPAATAAHFGIDAAAWKTLCERAAMFYYGFLGARYDPTERKARHEAYLEAARRIAAGAAPESLGLPNIGIAGDNRSCDAARPRPSIRGVASNDMNDRPGRHDPRENVRR